MMPSMPASRQRFDDLVAGLRLPLVAAPMTGASGLDLVRAAASAGVVASFPVHNCASPETLDEWLHDLAGDPGVVGPVVPNLVVHRSNRRLSADLDVLMRHRVAAIITSVGSPDAVVERMHSAGALVLSDVASMRHVEKAIDAGADGLVLLSAGAGGQTGWANPLAFIRAVRRIWDGPLILAGGVVDGTSLLASLVAGCDLGYMGTPFLATRESAVPEDWKQAVVDATLDDIEVTSAFTGLPTSMIRGAEPTVSSASKGEYDVAVLNNAQDASSRGPARYSAGHSVVGVDSVIGVAELVQRVEQQFRDAALGHRVRGLTEWED
jgi:nitronate monooxygenase